MKKDAHLIQQALASLQSGQPDEAEALLERCARLAPGNAMVHHLRGIAALQRGAPGKAVLAIKKSLQIDSSNEAAWSNLGVAHNSLGQFKEALPCFEQALRKNPADAVSLKNKGIALRHLARIDESATCFRRATALNPADGEAWLYLADIQAEQGILAEALDYYQKCISANPRHPFGFNNRATALFRARRYSEAVESFRQAIQLAPRFAEAHSGLGLALNSLGRSDDAHAHLKKAVALAPHSPELHVNLASFLLNCQRYVEAAVVFGTAASLKTGSRTVRAAWISAKMLACEWNGIEHLWKDLGTLIERKEVAVDPFPLLASPLPISMQRKCAEGYVKLRWSTGMPQQLPLREPARDGKIRIGYFSADLHKHATAYLMAGLFEQHDRSRFHLTAFSFGPARDVMTERIQAAFDCFVDVRDKSEAEIASLAREMGIDIAVDLKGFTKDARTAIFAHRAAPIQVNYLGYPGTMGAEFIDYLIADEVVVPDKHREHYTEKIVRLPGCYQVNDASRAISSTAFTRKDAGLPETGFVFCCFNASNKITPDVFDTWMRLLQKTPGSVLWLYEADPAVSANLRREASKRDIAEERLVFARRMDLPQHLARHRLADLFLDTFYYNAHTTASDALWAGLPVLTLLGESFAGRVGASLVHAVGLPELVTTSREAYEARALELASDPDLLGNIRKRLQESLPQSPLFNTTLFARRIEAAYSAMWQRYAAGLGPDHVEVS